MTLPGALPLFTREMESALLQIGRGDIVDQLREAVVDRWEFDDFANTASIFVTFGNDAPAPRPGARSETVSIYDELGVILETDDRGRIAVIEVSGGKDLVAQLEAAR
jgi:hypothetical protein